MTANCHSLAELPQHHWLLQNPITAGRGSHYMTVIGLADHFVGESLITSAVLGHHWRRIRLPAGHHPIANTQINSISVNYTARAGHR
ncbi:MAG: hypothetical protein ACYST6_15355 [Planctomycetota bacterium]|jgi:hypothetical protein